MLRRLFGLPTQAQSAGRKAGRAWKNILYHSRLDLEDFATGKDAYSHANEDATRWLESYLQARSITYTGLAEISKVNVHQMRLEYVEAFLKELEPELRSKGQPKE